MPEQRRIITERHPEPFTFVRTGRVTVVVLDGTGRAFLHAVGLRVAAEWAYGTVTPEERLRARRLRVVR